MELVPLLKPRHYSIASSPLVVPGEVLSSIITSRLFLSSLAASPRLTRACLLVVGWRTARDS